MTSPVSTTLRWIFLLLGLVLLFGVNLLTGSVDIPFADVVGALTGGVNDYSDLVWKFRLPKAATCVLAGSALAVSGLLMQTLFRNPLAGPDVLGLTSGSGLFVAIILLAGQQLSPLILTNPWSLALASSLGAAIILVAVLTLSRYVSDNTSLLIIGLMIAATASSVVGVLQYLSRAEDLQAFMIWGLGNVGGTGWEEIGVLAIVTLTGSALAFAMMKPLNTLLLGENYATSLGINVKRSRLIILVATSVMTGGVTAFCGPIAFVGLAVPHLVRLLVPTTNHKILIPAVIAGGGILLLLCDMLAQLPGSTQLLPLNAVTSLFGGPVVIWLVIRSKKIRI